MGILVKTEIYRADAAELRKQELAELTRPLSQSEVMALLIEQQINTLTVDDDTAVRMTCFYPGWAVGVEYSEDHKVQYADSLYRCITAHTSTGEWTPTAAPSLWAMVLTSASGQALPWEQPDSTNPYAAGEKVTHNGKTWVSTVDKNVWEPGVYGWTEA